jgi:hypothetical protein
MPQKPKIGFAAERARNLHVSNLYPSPNLELHINAAYTKHSVSDCAMNQWNTHFVPMVQR